jgi:DNA-binding transcriptional regulator GbsR (MarR family)
MTTTTDHAAVQQFIERLGLLCEEDGLPRIAGRIFGFLLLQATPCSLDDMADALDVSKASVSTDVRRLVQLGFVTRSSQRGDRRDYYMMSSDWAVRALRSKLESIRRFNATIREARDIVGDDPTVTSRLDSFEIVHEHFLASITSLLGKLGQPVAGLAADTRTAGQPAS